MAAQLGIKVEVTKVSENNYSVLFKIEEGSTCNITDNSCSKTSSKDYAVIINSDKMGTGDDGFGKKLLEGFIYALAEQDVLPGFVVCYNSGVKLTTELLTI